MDDDQQFCLRWNNHQSTLVSVFDNLLENGTLVDCTLFAEGKFLKAHKVVLSACSPYFESLLTQEYDKHPIFILKDVKFQELKAMMDYMYRGEVNISQDQLAALLKAAESLQIKGLSDSRSKENDTRKAAPPPPPAKTPPPAPTLPRVQGLTIEQRKTPKLSTNTDVTEESRSRDGSMSPVPRKRKKPRRRTSNSQDGILNDNHDASSSSESHSNPAANALALAGAQNINIPSASSSASLTLPTVPLASTSKLTDVPEQQLQLKLDPKSEILTRQTLKLPQSSVSSDSIPQVPIKEKLETHSELILEPKSEYIEEEMNEDSVEDLTLEDDDDVSQMEQEMDHARPGPSHGSTDGSQGFGGWHMSGNQAQDEVFLAAQEAVGAHRDSQDEEYFDQEVEQEIEYAEDITDQIPEEEPEPEPEPQIPEKTKVMTTKVVRIIPVEAIRTNEIIGEQLKKELSPHLTFDNAKLIKNVNKKIVDKEISLNKLPQTAKNVVHLQQITPGKSVYVKRKTLVASRMEKFLAMTASDCKDSKTKVPACLNPVLKTPVDTIRCTFCDELYIPTKKSEHKKVCRKTKQALPAYGCLLCSFKSTSQEQAALHVKTHHK